MYRLIFLFVFTTVMLLAGCVHPTPAPKMIYKPLDLRQSRIQLIRRYRCQHYMMCDRDVTIKPRMIVLHWTQTHTWQQAYQRFRKPHIDSHSPLSKYGALNLSTQFLVTRNGTIYQLMPSDWLARHVVGLDYLAIGIANVGGVGNKADLTQAQINADVYLIGVLKKQYPSIDYLIGHYEYQCFRHTPLWQEHYKNQVAVKKGPGVAFMRVVRERVASLDLQGCPS